MTGEHGGDATELPVMTRMELISLLFGVGISLGGFSCRGWTFI